MLKIISLANGDYEMLTVGAVRAIADADAVVLQTEKAPCAGRIKKEAKEFFTLDRFFEDAQDFEALYEAGAAFVCGLAAEKTVVFGVLGGLSANGFVASLRKKTVFETLPGASYESEAQCLAAGYMDIGALQSVPARDIKTLDLNSRAAVIVTGIDGPLLASEVRLFLEGYYEDAKAVLLSGKNHRLISLAELDSQTEYGTGCTLVLPALAAEERTRYTFGDLVSIMARLRGPGGCPWDLKQTHETLRQYVLEEAYEVAAAVDSQDPDALADELGDLLLQVVFHAQIGRQCGTFDITDVTSNICAKMILRHPHIFGNVRADSAEEVLTNWAAIKRVEKGHSTHTQVLKDIPDGMSALMRAYKLQKKAAQVGFDWEDAAGALAKAAEEEKELREEMGGGDADRIEAEAGDLLFAWVNVLRKTGVNPEVALSRASRKFIARFAHMEKSAKTDLKDLTLSQLDALWEAAKRAGI
jgi:tetrapyrrole methylase family protein/MazG family protein